LLNHFVSLGLRGSGTQPSSQIKIHGLGYEAGAGIELQNAFPARGGVAGFFQQFPLRGG